jgi:hypothetical protein
VDSSVVVSTNYVPLNWIAQAFVVNVKNIPLVRKIPVNLTVVGGPKQTAG